jgi:polysaccharide export outer membrane protein
VIVNTDTATRPEESDIVDIGDKLNIQVYKEPDISGVFTVNSSGKIGYPLIGEIYAQSLSLDELKQFLFDKLNEKYVSNPQIEITITESPNKSVSVLGQVTKPGNYILTHHLTLLKLISQNGGFTPDASTKTVRIVRSREDGKKETLEVNVDKVIQGLDQDLALKSGDIIFVDFQNKEEAKKEVLKNYITLLGQVSKPGNYFFSSKLTLIRLVGEAGGFTPVAATNRLKIIRQTKEGKQVSFMVDAASIMNGSKDVELMEGDLIIVPESFF